jgi:CheY-like chemotaxis protein
VYQGIVLDFDLPEQDGMELLRRVRGDSAHAGTPAVLYTERALDPATLEQLAELGATVVGSASEAVQHGRDEAVAAFLQQVRGALPAPQPDVAHGALAAPFVDGLLVDKCVLLVDDDVRNLFALTGLLEGYGMKVNAVGSGEEALRQLDLRSGIDLVLMDIMMPDMDGYEAIRRIRADPRFARLPIIALTAKAMLEDRSKCLAAGASDYASKPVDTVQLIAQLHVWLAEPPLRE